jgi:MFS family permease
MAFEAFQERDYRWFWTSQFFSNIGSWMQAVAQGWLVYHLTDSPFLLGFVGFANSIPTLFLMLPGGVVADRFDRRRVISASQWAQALSALFLAVAIRTHQISVWQIIVASIVVGVAVSFSAPAYQAMVVDLLDDRSRLPNAVAMNSLQFNLSRAVGPLLAGVTLSAYGSFWCFLFNAISFLPLIWVLGRLQDRQHRSERGPMVSQLAAGFRYVLNERVILILLAIVGAASLFGYPYLAIMPMIARSLFTDDAHGLGILMSGIGGGALVGSLALSLRTPPRRLMMPVILTSLIAFGIAVMSIGFVRSQGVITAVLAVAGAAMVLCVALCNTSIQSRVPDAMRGRVLSMYTFAFYAFLPVGSLVAGLIAEHRGLAPTMVVLGGGLLLSAVAAMVAITVARRRLGVTPARAPAPHKNRESRNT